jgi:CDP-2,3-bis-(O-geranylgeranyl)-sn-glycerol synthase
MGIANMAPVILPGRRPIDFGKTWRGKRIFGKNKTWGGFIGGTVLGTITGFFLGNVYLGLAVSAGALLGDIFESFIKRRVGIPSGQQWLVFDQIDFVIGALILGSFVQPIAIKPMIILLIGMPILHPVANYLGYLLKLKKNKF